MGAERRRILFRYRRGDVVGKASTPETWLVVRQRYETREVLPPLVQYLLRSGDVDMWVDEPDVIAPPQEK